MSGGGHEQSSDDLEKQTSTPTPTPTSTSTSTPAPYRIVLSIYKHRHFVNCITFISILYTTITSLYLLKYMFANNDQTTLISVFNQDPILHLHPYNPASYTPNEAARSSYKFSPELGVSSLKSNSPNYHFLWSDWVNLTDLYNHEQLNTPFRWFQLTSRFYERPMGHGTPYEIKRTGQTYLERYAPSPDKIILLDGKDQTKTETHVIRQTKDYRRINTSLAVYAAHKATQQKNLLPPLNINLTNSVPAAHRLLIPSDKNTDYFDVDFKKQTKDDDSLEQIYHSEAIIDTLKCRKYPKFFWEPSIANDAGGLHYDWRFFSNSRNRTEIAASLHHMTRTWSDFARREGVMWWMSHGALIGWNWNGLSLPWDTDIDIQMPIAELDRVARRYNNTLIVQDPSEGNGRYLLLVSPYYIQRVKGNGLNNIDARFIDINTGMFIDITALARTSRNQNIETVNCKAPHHYSPSDIFPLHLTAFEGTSVYIPHNVYNVLIDEYHDYESPLFKSYIFYEHLGLWIRGFVCGNITEPDKFFVGSGNDAKEDGKENDQNLTLTRYGACNNDEIWSMYNRTHEATQTRAREIMFYETHVNSTDEITSSFVEQYSDELISFAAVLKPLWPTPEYTQVEMDELIQTV